MYHQCYVHVMCRNSSGEVETRSQNFTVEFVVIKHFGRESIHVEPSCG